MNALRWILAVVLIIAGAIVTDWWRRCHGEPLTREEAVSRATERVKRFSQSHKAGDISYAVREIAYEYDSKSWRITFGDHDCIVVVIVDRCHGDDIGGTTRCSSQ